MGYLFDSSLLSSIQRLSFLAFVEDHRALLSPNVGFVLLGILSLIKCYRNVFPHSGLIVLIVPRVFIHAVLRRLGLRHRLPARTGSSFVTSNSPNNGPLHPEGGAIRLDISTLLN